MSTKPHYYELIRRPVVTEKSTVMQEAQNQYTFEVAPDANKSEVKKAVESLFKVHVVRVNVVNLPGKSRRTFGRPGETRAWKKAIVTVREGEVIEVA